MAINHVKVQSSPRRFKATMLPSRAATHEALSHLSALLQDTVSEEDKRIALSRKVAARRIQAAKIRARTLAQKREAAGAMRAIGEKCRELSEVFKRKIAEIEENAFNISIALARRILEKELSIDSGFYLRELSKALTQAEPPFAPTVHVSSNMPPEITLTLQKENIYDKVVTDPSLPPHTAELRFRAGSVRINIDNYLDQLVTKMRAV